MGGGGGSGGLGGLLLLLRGGGEAVMLEDHETRWGLGCWLGLLRLRALLRRLFRGLDTQKDLFQ